MRTSLQGTLQHDASRLAHTLPRRRSARSPLAATFKGALLLVTALASQSSCLAQAVDPSPYQAPKANSPLNAPGNGPANGPTSGGAPAPGASRPAADPGRSAITEFPSGAPAASRRASSPRAYSHSAPQHIDLFHGQARLLPVTGAIRRIAIGNGGVVGATSVEDGILLLAETAGTSSLIIWTDNRVDEYLVNVSDQDMGQSLRYMQAIFRDHPGVTVEQMGDRLIVRGSVFRATRDELAVQLRGIPNIVNLLREEEGFPKKKTIHFRVQIVELAKTVSQDLGILWDTQFSGPRVDVQGTAVNGGIFHRLPALADPTDLFALGRTPAGVGGAIGGAFIGIASSITSRINLALNNGEATVLASPEVSTASGGEARFLAGGQVPIVTSSFGGTSVEYKDYGIVLNIKPLVDSNNNISASIETEVSQIDPSVTYGGFPAFLTRKSRSDVSLRPLETLAISGLVNSNWARTADKVPLLGDVPVLGRLFRSDAFLNKRTDLVIFVTPEVTEPLGETNRTLIERSREISGRIPAVETDPRYTPFTPPSTNTSPSPDSPPPPTPRAPVAPAPIPGGPGVPTPLTYDTAPPEDIR